MIVLAKRKKARVLLNDSVSGQWYNGKTVELEPELLYYIKLAAVENVEITARGGGQSAQLQAARLALAKYIVAVKPELRAKLIETLPTILTSDGRQSEAKRAECRGARRRRQKSYR